MYEISPTLLISRVGHTSLSIRPNEQSGGGLDKHGLRAGVFSIESGVTNRKLYKVGWRKTVSA